MASSGRWALVYIASLFAVSTHYSLGTSANAPQEYSAAPGGTNGAEPELARGTPPTQRLITGSPAPGPALGPAGPEQSGGAVEGRTICWLTGSCWGFWWGRPPKPKPSPPPPPPPRPPPCNGCNWTPVIFINNYNLNNHQDRIVSNNINILSAGNKCDKPSCSSGGGAVEASAVPVAVPSAGYSLGFANGQGGSSCSTCPQGRGLVGSPENATAGHGELPSPSAIHASAGRRAGAVNDPITAPHTTLDARPGTGTALPPDARESVAGSVPPPDHEAPHPDSTSHGPLAAFGPTHIPGQTDAAEHVTEHVTRHAPGLSSPLRRKSVSAAGG